MSQRISFNARTPWERTTPTGLLKIKPCGSHYSLLAFNNSAFIRGLSVCALRPRVWLNLFPGIYLHEDTCTHCHSHLLGEWKAIWASAGWPRWGLYSRQRWCYWTITETSWEYYRRRCVYIILLLLLWSERWHYSIDHTGCQIAKNWVTTLTGGLDCEEKEGTATNRQRHGQRHGLINTQRN